MAFKGEPLAGPLYNSDQNTTHANFQSLKSMPREEGENSPSQIGRLAEQANRSVPASIEGDPRGRNYIGRDNSTKDTGQNHSVGKNSGPFDPMQTIDQSNEQ